VLQTAAERIRQTVRPHDTVARWGGDEFVVLLEQLPHEDVALTITARIAAALAEPLDRIRPGLSVTASVGLVLGRPDEHIDSDQLITQADAAMYSVKHRGRNGWAVYEAASGVPGQRPESAQPLPVAHREAAG
jgi:diguanylate cyclase (GGDEF)-like protein